MRKAWLILALILGIIATTALANALYWLMTGQDIELGPSFIGGTFTFPIFLYLLTFGALLKARS